MAHFQRVPSQPDLKTDLAAVPMDTLESLLGTSGAGLNQADAHSRLSTYGYKGGGIFDFAWSPAMNENSDIAFTGHVAGAQCLATLPPKTAIYCAGDLFVRRSRTGKIERIARVGQAAPGGGSFRDISCPVVNTQGDILFRAALDEPSGISSGYFLSRDGAIVAIARNGDPMPGGGNFVVAALQPGNWDLNDRGEVAFSATLDTFENLLGEFGAADQAIYIWRDGMLSLAVRTGDGVPGGEIVALQPPNMLFDSMPFSGAQINNVGELLFQATILDENTYEGYGALYVQK